MSWFCVYGKARKRERKIYRGIKKTSKAPKNKGEKERGGGRRWTRKRKRKKKKKKKKKQKNI